MSLGFYSWFIGTPVLQLKKCLKVVILPEMVVLKVRALNSLFSTKINVTLKITMPILRVGRVQNFQRVY